MPRAYYFVGDQPRFNSNGHLHHPENYEEYHGMTFYTQHLSLPALSSTAVMGDGEDNDHLGSFVGSGSRHLPLRVQGSKGERTIIVSNLSMTKASSHNPLPKTCSCSPATLGWILAPLRTYHNMTDDGQEV